MNFAAIIGFIQALPDLIKIWNALAEKIQESQRTAAIARAVELYTQQKDVGSSDEAYAAAVALQRIRTRGK